MHWVREANLEHRIEKIIALKYNRLVRKAKYFKKPLDPKIVNTTEQIENRMTENDYTTEFIHN